MEKKALLAVILSFVVLYLYQIYFVREEADKTTPGKTVSEEIPKKGDLKTLPSSELDKKIKDFIQTPSLKEREEKEIKVTTNLFSVNLTSKGGRIKEFTLFRYKDKIGPGAKGINLMAFPEPSLYFPQLVLKTPESSFYSDSISYEVKGSSLKIDEKNRKAEVLFYGQLPQGIRIYKRFIFFYDEYRFDLDYLLGGPHDSLLNGEFVMEWKNPRNQEKNGNGQGKYHFVSLIGNDLISETKEKIEEKSFSGEVKWLGFDDTYFLKALIPLNPLKDFVINYSSSREEDNLFLLYPPEKAHTGDNRSLRLGFYFGPKDIEILKKAGFGLEKSLNLGWFEILAKPLLLFLKFINRFANNYGISIIFLTILIKVLFWPLTHKSYKSMKAMQKIQPHLQKLREKHKDDKEKLNKETMDLYRAFKVNPLGGCLPMLIQMPVFFALYQVLSYAIELRHAPFFVWINDLSSKDPYYITPILMGISMFFQQKMSPTVGDPTQAKVMLFMPLIFTVFFLNFPSGLVIYWLVNNILSIIQQIYIDKYIE